MLCALSEDLEIIMMQASEDATIFFFFSYFKFLFIELWLGWNFMCLDRI